MQTLLRLSYVSLLFVFLLSNAHAAFIEITLLGTGTPLPDIKRFGPATVVEAGGRYFVFDSGRGITMRLQQADIPLNKIEHIFLTHLHSDHVSGLADLWLTSWIFQREKNIKVYGPVGVKQLTQHTQQAHKADIDYRVQHAGLRLDAVDIKAIETTEDGVIYDEDDVRVIAFRVDHGVVKPAYGYRLEHKNRSVIISGDTRYSENLVKYSQNADVIVHEIAAAGETLLNKNSALKNIMVYHTSPEQMIKVLHNTKPRVAVLSHVLLYGITEEQVLNKLRQQYSGELFIGEDLMRIQVGEEIVIN